MPEEAPVERGRLAAETEIATYSTIYTRPRVPHVRSSII